jgi:hypothetical protein
LIDITRLSPAELDRFIHIQSVIARQQEDADKVKAARDYYKGDHPVMLTQRQQEFLGKDLTSGDYQFNHNLVKVVVDTLRERLNVTGFTVNGRSAEDSDNADGKLAAMLWQWWKHNKLESQQIRLYRRALRDGKSYVMVDYDNDHARPRLTMHEVDDGATGIVLHRDPSDENRTLFASRYFFTFNPLEPGKTGIERKTVYLPGEIRKYERTSAINLVGSEMAWRPIMDDGDLAWPLAWYDTQGKPLGVAAIEFQNPGGSEVDSIAGLQNALNKAWLDLIAAADATGFPILTANYRDPQPMPSSISDDDDIEGSDEFIIAPGRLLEIFGGDIRRIEAANLEPMMKGIWSIVDAISGLSRTPQQFLRPFPGIDIPSGEALKQLEAGLVKKAEERQLYFGEAWADVMGLAYRVAHTFGQGVPDVGDDPVIGVQWADANTRMEAVEAGVAKIHKDLGVPDDAVWAKAGYSPDQIAQFKENARLQRAQEIATIAAAARQTQTNSQNSQQQGNQQQQNGAVTQ